MNTFADFLASLGGLHDAIVVSLNWQAEQQVLEFILDDLYANFRGMPEYPGRRSGLIRLRGISHLSIGLDSSERLRIFEFLADERQHNLLVVKFSPGGYLHIKCASADYPPNELLKPM